MKTVAVPRPQLGSGVELFESALTVPYAAGMRTDIIPLVEDAFAVTGPRREPVLLARLRRGLADEAIVVRPNIPGDGSLSTVTFAPFSAEGTLLPLFRPQLPEGSDGTGDFTIEVSVHIVTGEERLSSRPATGAPMAPSDAAAIVEALVMEGRFARFLYLGTLEKQRCIREARQIVATRHLTLAHSAGLDGRGRDLGVSRLPRGKDKESDDEFRARLAIYSTWRMATPAGFAKALNGPGAETEPNAGLPALAEVTDRFRIVEQINELSVATKLIAVGPSAAGQRTRFHDILRTAYLIDLDGVTPSLMPQQRREQYEAIRTNLQAELTRPDVAERPRHLASLVAVTLDRTVRLVRALGHTAEIRLLRAHDSTAGGTYEFGLGIDLSRFTEAELDNMAEGVSTLVESDDALGNLAGALTPRSFDDDPLGRWLLEPCGFRTVHAIDDNTVLLSPFPIYGQRIDGPDGLAIGEAAIYESRYHASGATPGLHVRAKEAADSVAVVFASNEMSPVPAALTPDQLRTVLESFAAVSSAPELPESLDASAAAGIVAVDSKTLASVLLNTLNLDQIVAFSITQPELEALGVGDDLRDALVENIDALGEAGFYSVRGIFDDSNSRLLLLASVSQLPGASSKIGEPPPAAFYWYEMRLPKPEPGLPDPIELIQRRGGRATVRADQEGLALLVCIGYARRGLADPFEVRVELPDIDTVLSHDQYGYLMNLLEFLYPIGIEINTFDIRRRHVDADGDGEPEFLTSRVSRTYHRYRHRRPIGSDRGREHRGATP